MYKLKAGSRHLIYALLIVVALIGSNSEAKKKKPVSDKLPDDELMKLIEMVSSTPREVSYSSLVQLRTLRQELERIKKKMGFFQRLLNRGKINNVRRALDFNEERIFSSPESAEKIPEILKNLDNEFEERIRKGPLTPQEDANYKERLVEWGEVLDAMKIDRQNKREAERHLTNLKMKILSHQDYARIIGKNDFVDLYKKLMSIRDQLKAINDGKTTSSASVEDLKSQLREIEDVFRKREEKLLKNKDSEARERYSRQEDHKRFNRIFSEIKELLKSQDSSSSSPSVSNLRKFFEEEAKKQNSGSTRPGGSRRNNLKQGAGSSESARGDSGPKIDAGVEAMKAMRYYPKDPIDTEMKERMIPNRVNGGKADDTAESSSAATSDELTKPKTRKPFCKDCFSGIRNIFKSNKKKLKEEDTADELPAATESDSSSDKEQSAKPKSGFFSGFRKLTNKFSRSKAKKEPEEPVSHSKFYGKLR